MWAVELTDLFWKPLDIPLVGRFKFFSTISAGKCRLFSVDSPPKNGWKTQNVFSNSPGKGEKPERKMENGEKGLSFSPTFSAENL